MHALQYINARETEEKDQNGRTTEGKNQIGRVRRVCVSVTSADDEVHEMENLLSSPTVFRYSEFNSNKLNLQH